MREQLAQVGDRRPVPVVAFEMELVAMSTSGSRISTAVIPIASAPVSSRYEPSPQYRHEAGSTSSRSHAKR